MRASGASLDRVIRPRPGTCTAVVGAGGKTTTIMRLTEELLAKGESVVIATTTKIWPPPGLPVAYPGAGSELPPDPPAAGQAQVLAARLGPDRKLHGLSPESVCDVLEKWPGATILCEADGAAGRSLKAHRPGEPVIPGCAATVVVVAGVDSVGKVLDSETVHRPELFASLVGVPEGSTISPRHVALALQAAGRYAPPGARRIYLLSRVDGADAAAVAVRVALHLNELDPVSLVVSTSRARVTGVLEPLSGARGSW